jgi:hypothetical protein
MGHLLGLFLIATSLFLSACGTTDGSLRNEGRGESYIQGFHDGRHSGMKEEGNPYEHFIKDEARFRDDTGYRSGWMAGEVEGNSLQDQAVAVGNAAAGAYSSSQISKEAGKSTDFDKTAKDAVKGVDTTGMENLRK